MLEEARSEMEKQVKLLAERDKEIKALREASDKQTKLHNTMMQNKVREYQDQLEEMKKELTVSIRDKVERDAHEVLQQTVEEVKAEAKNHLDQILKAKETEIGQLKTSVIATESQRDMLIAEKDDLERNHQAVLSERDHFRMKVER